MKIKTSELTGAALDWAVAKANGIPLVLSPFTGSKRYVLANQHGKPTSSEYRPSSAWAQGGQIIEREGLAVRRAHDSTWRADYSEAVLKADGSAYAYLHAKGPTPLIAAMRCYVASKLGYEVDVPEELL